MRNQKEIEEAVKATEFAVANGWGAGQSEGALSALLWVLGGEGEKERIFARCLASTLRGLAANKN